MNIGITGTRDGFTEQQRETYQRLLRDHVGNCSLHHGDCIGVDVQAARDYAALSLNLSSCREIVCHPPIDETYRGFVAIRDPLVKDMTVTLPPKTHFARNRDIVDASDVLLAFPLTAERQTKGGTEYTIGYALKKKKWTKIVLPDGTVQEYNKPQTVEDA